MTDRRLLDSRGREINTGSDEDGWQRPSSESSDKAYGQAHEKVYVAPTYKESSSESTGDPWAVVTRAGAIIGIVGAVIAAIYFLAEMRSDVDVLSRDLRSFDQDLKKVDNLVEDNSRQIFQFSVRLDEAIRRLNSKAHPEKKEEE